MALQPSVVEYFNNRKRPAEELKKTNPNKVLVLDSSTHSDVGSPNSEINCKLNRPTSEKKLVYNSRPTIEKGHCLLKNPKSKLPTSAKSRSTQSRPSVVKKKLGQISKHDCNQMDIRKTLLKISNNKSEEPLGETCTKQRASVSSIVSLFKLLFVRLSLGLLGQNY